MSTEFNMLEVFEIAEQIERNGAEFYRRAAELFDEPGIHKMFVELSIWEIRHQKVFEDMRKELSSRRGGQKKSRAGDDMLIDAKAMAGLSMFGIRLNPAGELKGNETIVDVLKGAMVKEKDSIVYYTGLKEFVSAQNGKDKIDDIIKEELRHIRILSQSLEQRE